MNFQKNSEGEGGVISDLKNFVEKVHQTEVIHQVQVKEQNQELRGPLAEVNRRQRDEHLRNSLRRHNLPPLWCIWLVPRLALEHKLRKVGGKT